MAKERLHPRREGALTWREATAVSIAALVLPASNLLAGTNDTVSTAAALPNTAAVASSYEDLDDIRAAKIAAQKNGERTKRLTLASRSAGRTAVAKCFTINPKKLHHTKPENYDNIQLACELAKQQPWAKKDFTGQMNALVYDLWDPESGWDETADNPSSSAHGIPQALPGKKMGPGWQNSAKAQIKWGLNYITERYGDPKNAVRIRETRGWY